MALFFELAGEEITLEIRVFTSATQLGVLEPSVHKQQGRKCRSRMKVRTINLKILSQRSGPIYISAFSETLLEVEINF